MSKTALVNRGSGKCVIQFPKRAAPHMTQPRSRVSASPDTLSERRSSTGEISVRTLINRIIAAGGELTIKDPQPTERAAWRRAFHAATTRGGVPSGLRLRYTGRDSGDLVLRLVPDIPANAPVQPQPARIHVLDRLTQAHPIVAQLEEHPERLGVSETVVTRALRILGALVDAAARRGYGIKECGPDDKAAVQVVLRGHAYPVTLTEERGRTPHVPTEAELAEVVRHPWVQLPEYEYFPSGQLSISLGPYWRPGHPRMRRHTWSDRNRWRLEDKLGHVLAELEQRAELDDRRQAEERERHAEGLRRFDQSWQRVLTEHRADCLRHQVDALRFANEIRAFCAALRASPPSSDGRKIGDELKEWLAWAEEYAGQIDPRMHPPAMPADPPPEFDRLKPYLTNRTLRSRETELWREWVRKSNLVERLAGTDDYLDF